MVLLKDTSGNFHEIAKDSFMSAVRGALGSLIKSYDKGTNINGVAVTGSTGTVNDLGFSSPSDLATVLGVKKRYEFVDMGLPSGTLWASKNLGAETPEDYGYYFSWGNFIGHKPNGSTFDYNWGSGNDGPYASTPGEQLTGDIPAANDAALRYFGGSCKMPTVTQYQELFNSSYTTNEWVENYRGTGVNGRLVTSKINGNTLFFPAAGNGYGTSLSDAGAYGGYWSRSLHSSANGYHLYFNSSGVNPASYNSRFFGFSVRAVQ